MKQKLLTVIMTLFAIIQARADWHLSDDGVLTITSDYWYSTNGTQRYPWDGRKKDIKQVIFTDDVTYIGEQAFSNCPNLHSVVIPSSIKEIGTMAFYVKKVFFLTKTEPKMDSYSFPGCNVYYTQGTTKFTKIGGTHKSYSLLNSMFEVDGIKYIPTDQKNCDMVDVNYSIDSINSNIGPTVKYTNANGRKYDFNVCNVNISAGYECEGFSDLKLNNIGSIEYRAFSYSSVSSIEVSNSIASVDNYAFSGCNKATSIIISNNGYVGDYAFCNCTAANSITVANNVTSIGNYAFSGNESLTSFSLGSGVKTIGTEAFAKCNALIDFTSYSMNPATVGSKCFADIDKLECTLHVSEGASDAYMSAIQWNEFWIEEDAVTNVTNINSNPNTPRGIYNIMGCKLTEPQKGFNIIDGKKVIIK